jgi:hypothetical protein
MGGRVSRSLKQEGTRENDHSIHVRLHVAATCFEWADLPIIWTYLVAFAHDVELRRRIPGFYALIDTFHNFVPKLVARTQKTSVLASSRILRVAD